MTTKTKFIIALIIAITLIATFLAGAISSTGHDIARNYDSWFAPVVAKATYTEHITEEESEINAMAQTADVKEACHSIATVKYQLSKSVEAEKAKSMADAKRFDAIDKYNTSVNNMYASTSLPLTSIKGEARAMILGK